MERARWLPRNIDREAQNAPGGTRLQGGLVKEPGDVGHEERAAFGVGEATGEDDEDERAGSEDDGGIMMNFGDFAGLVGYACAGRQAGGDAFVEMLALEDFEHLAGGIGIDGFAFGDSRH